VGEFLTCLTELSAPDNEIAGLPGNLARCRFSLVAVDLERNRLAELPAALLALTRLTRLGLSGNGISELPLALGRLLYLQDLTVPDSDLGSVPLCVVRAGGRAVIRYMCGLEECGETGLLDLSAMNLDFLPPAVRAAGTSLTTLKLDDNPRLALLPNWVGEFQRLRRVSLRATGLVRLPASLGAIQVPTVRRGASGLPPHPR
jgi:Leucine-rich repeat (LRR) protein